MNFSRRDNSCNCEREPESKASNEGLSKATGCAVEAEFGPQHPTERETSDEHEAHRNRCHRARPQTTLAGRGCRPRVLLGHRVVVTHGARGHPDGPVRSRQCRRCRPRRTSRFSSTTSPRASADVGSLHIRVNGLGSLVSSKPASLRPLLAHQQIEETS